MHGGRQAGLPLVLTPVGITGQGGDLEHHRRGGVTPMRPKRPARACFGSNANYVKADRRHVAHRSPATRGACLKHLQVARAPRPGSFSDLKEDMWL